MDRYGFASIPPYPDLNPCGAIVYSKNLQTLEYLEQFVCEVCVSILVKTLKLVVSNFTFACVMSLCTVEYRIHCNAIHNLFTNHNLTDYLKDITFC
ncbi:hypothetical protein CDAR_218131 [Caerostris darwini]|uniref:Uncharacterized protein n=1 Tax=Caerostris darwini TaxID=1538125 RepID=A0AAV4TIF2_9ARAC|nr:hypothetical protein CDAR_218131 [Caerostris darwini]